MKVITVHGISLQFDGDQITHGSAKAQVLQAVDLINGVLQREPYGLGCQLLVNPDELRIETETSPEEDIL